MDGDRSATVTHPSVRLRGTEHDYTPQDCTDPFCGNAVARKDNYVATAVGCSPPQPHMHCPFCVPTDVYHDAVILRVHYRVKHVDKGIDFAGLRILRCCKRCDIVGAIKGEKKFKGAHWHCYRCKNGFNRRDEAFKHYRTHFRNPLTTFQIHIAQEVNESPQHDHPNHGVALVEDQPVVQWDVDSASSQLEKFDGELTAAATAAVVLVRRDGDIADDEPMNEQIEVATSAFAVGEHLLGSADASEQDVLGDAEPWEVGERVLRLERENEELRLRNEQLEQHYKDEIQQFKMQVELYAKEVEHLRKREQDLLRYLVGDSCDRSQEMIASLQAQHTQLLQQHLLQVRQCTLNQQQETDLTVTTTTTEEEEEEAPSSLSFPSDVFTLILDERGALVTPTKLLVHNETTGIADSSDAEIVVESLVDEIDDDGRCDAVLST